MLLGILEKQGWTWGGPMGWAHRLGSWAGLMGLGSTLRPEYGQDL